MPTDRELMQQALDVLKACRPAYEAQAKTTVELQRWQLETIEALRARLAQPEQDGECQYCNGAGCIACDARFLSSEPVAWMDEFGFILSASETDGTGLRNIPLFTAPPQREWQGLTDEERYLNEGRSDEELKYARSIEAKLKEKNT